MVIFFDIDGTLLNQRQAELTAARQIVRVFRSELPVDISTLEVSRKWRRSREKYLPAWLNGNISYAEYHRRRIRELFDAPEMTDHAADVRYESFHQAYRG